MHRQILLDDGVAVRSRWYHPLQVADHPGYVEKIRGRRGNAARPPRAAHDDSVDVPEIEASGSVAEHGALATDRTCDAVGTRAHSRSTFRTQSGLSCMIRHSC